MLGALAGGMAIYWGLAAMLAKRLRRQRAAAGARPSRPASASPNGCAATSSPAFPGPRPGLMADGMGGLAQAASLIGMTGLTAAHRAVGVAALCAARRTAAGASACSRARHRPAAARAVGLGRHAACGGDGADGAGRRLRIVQPNVPQEQKWREDNARDIFDELKQLSAMPTHEQAGGHRRRHPSGLARIGRALPDRREPGGAGPNCSRCWAGARR